MTEERTAKLKLKRKKCMTTGHGVQETEVRLQSLPAVDLRRSSAGSWFDEIDLTSAELLWKQVLTCVSPDLGSVGWGSVPALPEFTRQVAEKGQEKTAVTEVFEVGRQRFEWFPFPTALSPTVTEHPCATGVGYDTGRGNEELAEPKNLSHPSLDAVGHLEICSVVPGSKGNDRICNKNSPQDREALQSGAAKNSAWDREALQSGAAKNSAQDREVLQSGAAKHSAQVCEKLQSAAAKIIKEPMASQKGSAESVRASAASEKSSAKSIKAPQSLQKGLANSIKESQTSQKRSKKPLQGAQVSQKGSAKNVREPPTLPKQTYLWPTISKAKKETKRTEPPAQRASMCNDHVMDVEEEPASASRGGLQESADKAIETAGSLENCPICLMPFPKQFSQLDIDSHLAQCLSETTVDVVW